MRESVCKIRFFHKRLLSDGLQVLVLLIFKFSNKSVKLLADLRNIKVLKTFDFDLNYKVRAKICV